MELEKLSVIFLKYINITMYHFFLFGLFFNIHFLKYNPDFKTYLG
jgi:hypothetical protein